jgi:hypothetical protein
MPEELNNYNRAFESKTMQELNSHTEKLQSVEEKYQTFRQEFKKDIENHKTKSEANQVSKPVEIDDGKKPKRTQF